MTYDYYYDKQSETYSFFSIPRLLITDPHFKHVSMEAKLLYGLLLDRMKLSAKNGWYDDFGRVYIFYTVKEIEEDLCCGHEKAGRLLHELDDKRGVGLIERVKRGQGKPTIIYVKQFIGNEDTSVNFRPPKSGGTDLRKPDFQTSDFQRSRSPKTGCADIRNPAGNYNNKNQHNMKNTYSTKPCRDVTRRQMEMCCAIRSGNLFLQVRSTRRRRWTSAMSWRCAGRRANTHFLLWRIQTGLIPMSISITMPSRWIIRGSTGIS